ncbi:MAG: hypothetical protein KBC38_02135 [Candidatus Pacebacteria bacterium]|nr:hypothetical protein [Candidatus Paceibacterota bacterium]MBP9840677.1 hypothetical protein [Candidatus Paceibacterota bacterium]
MFDTLDTWYMNRLYGPFIAWSTHFFNCSSLRLAATGFLATTIAGIILILATNWDMPGGWLYAAFGAYLGLRALFSAVTAYRVETARGNSEKSPFEQATLRYYGRFRTMLASFAFLWLTLAFGELATYGISDGFFAQLAAMVVLHFTYAAGLYALHDHEVATNLANISR